VLTIRTVVLAMQPRPVDDGVSARSCARKSAFVSDPLVRVVNMGRPRTYGEDRIATAVRLPVSIHRRLHEVAADRDVSANLLVTRAVTDYLDRLPSADQAICGLDGAADGESR